jgi:nitrile hydratase
MASFDSEKAAKIHRHLHSHLPSDPALRVKALESLAIERGLVAAETLDSWVEAYAEHIGPKRGARVVARSWLDPEFRARLLDDAAEAIKDFGFEGSATGHLKAVANSAEVHNMVVSSARCVPVTLFRSSVCRRLGTNPPNTAPAPCANRAPF